MSALFDVLRALSDMRAEDMPSAHRLVLVMVANHANAIGRAWPSIGTLSRETGYGRTKIAEVLGELVERGWLRRDGSEGGPLHAAARYEVTLGRPWPEGSRASRRRPTDRLNAIRTADRTDPHGGYPPPIRTAVQSDPPRGYLQSDAAIRAAVTPDPPCEHTPIRPAVTPDPPGGHKPPSEPPSRTSQGTSQGNGSEQGFKLEAQEDPNRRKRRRPETPIPTGWGPSEEHFKLGRSLGFDAQRVKREGDRFADGARAKDRRYVDWHAAFANWLRNEQKFAEQRGERLAPIVIAPETPKPRSTFVYKPRFPGLFDKPAETPKPPPEPEDDEPEITPEQRAELIAKRRATLAELDAEEAARG